MAHCSNAGFSTFVMDLEVYGDVIIDGKIKFYEQPTKITFNHNIFNGGFAAAVRERAETLNHPKLWEKVLTKHNNLQICLAHFGGESDAWRSDIAGLMARFPKLYTDLSCMTKAERLKTIKTEYFNEDNTIVNRIMYGSDFYLNMLDKITFEDYYKHFRSVFSEAQLKNMNLTVPEKFLGI